MKMMRVVIYGLDSYIKDLHVYEHGDLKEFEGIERGSRGESRQCKIRNAFKDITC